jgi:DNA-binding response OmpR family regulator
MDKEPKNILIVDDEIKIIEVIESFLKSRGFAVFSAENGQSALKILDKGNISLVILDLMLPDISGEELCTIIRKKSRVPVIMLTAKIEEDDILKGLDIGADDYITKPFSLKTLCARIDAVLRRSNDSFLPLYNKSSFNNGDLEIDLQSHTIKKHQKVIKFTPSEFRILITLIKYPNKVFTREELIETALGDEFIGFDRVIDSHIKNIRQKIENSPKNPIYILTIHGTGYKFGGEGNSEI